MAQRTTDKRRTSPILSERTNKKRPTLAFGRKIETSATRKSVLSGISQSIEPAKLRPNQDLDATEENLGSGVQPAGELEDQKPNFIIRTQSGLNFENDAFSNTERESRLQNHN